MPCDGDAARYTSRCLLTIQTEAVRGFHGYCPKADHAPSHVQQVRESHGTGVSLDRAKTRLEKKLSAGLPALACTLPKMPGQKATGARRRSPDGSSRQPGPTWERGMRSTSFGMASGADSRQSYCAVKTTHQEKTYEMFRAYDKEIDKRSALICRAHIVVFAALVVLSVALFNVQMDLLAIKTRAVVSEEDVYTELMGMKNMSVTLRRVRALSNLFGSSYQRVLVQSTPLSSAYLDHDVYMQLYEIAVQIITGFESVKSYDNSIRSATRCFQQSGSGRRNSTCPLREAINRLRTIDPHLSARLREAVLTIKVPLSLVLEQKILQYYPAGWPDVYDPYKFVLNLITQGRFREIFERADMYFEELNDIVNALRSIRIWPRLLQGPSLALGLLTLTLLVFVGFVEYNSAQIARAFRICQDAVAFSDEEVQTNVADLSNVVLATLEHKILPRLHPLSGISALLLTSGKLTAYHLKLLKVMEKCTADMIAVCVNALDYIAAEAELLHATTDLADLRSLVEDCLESFRPKATSKQLPLSCLFGAGCPSLVMVDTAKLRKVLNREPRNARLPAPGAPCLYFTDQTLSYVLDHTFDKGMGIEVFINANASRSGKEHDDPDQFKAYDIHVEVRQGSSVGTAAGGFNLDGRESPRTHVKGLGVRMENQKAQLMVQTKGLVDRSGQGLRLLVSNKMLQSIGGGMKIQSSPLRGIFFSFAIRAKARFRLQDLHEDFAVIAGRQAVVITLGLSQETRRFFVFLCKDIGVQCVHCFSFKEMMDILAQVSENPSEKGSRALTPPEIFSRLQAATSRLNENSVKVFLASIESEAAGTSSQGSPDKFPVDQHFIRLTLPVHSSTLIELIVRGSTGGAWQDGNSLQDWYTRRSSPAAKKSWMTSLPFPNSSLLSAADGLERQPPAKQLRKSLAVGMPSRSPKSERADPVKQVRRSQATTHPNKTEDLSMGDADDDESADGEPLYSSLNLLVLDGGDILDGSPELFPMSDEEMEKLFCRRELIPECLYRDVNGVIHVLDQLGLSRRVGDIALALAESPMRRDLAHDSTEHSLQSAIFQVVTPGQDCSSDVPTRGPKKLAPSARFVVRGVTGSVAGLYAGPLPSQAYFNLVSTSPTDCEPLTMHQLLDWDFNVLGLSPPVAVRLTRDLLTQFAQQANLDIPGETIMKFSVAVYENYRPNPYHNFYHALNVAQVRQFVTLLDSSPAACNSRVLCLLLALPDVAAQFTPIDYLVLSVAALGHDLGHPGANNLFMTRFNCWPARIYQNVSVLENLHAASLFQILRDPAFNVFCSVAQTHFSQIRKRIISAILWTDMAKHFDVVAKLQAKIQGEMVLTEGIIVTLTKPYLEGLLLHAADISNPMMNFDMCRDWAFRACDEFYQQNKLEEEAGFPPFMPALGEFDDYNVAKCQVGFIDAICKPLFNSLALMFPAQLGDRATQLQKNR
ncbi:3 5 -cyclic nucleotide phosphodiesterase domain-containing protein [Cystoisospora suis]|uniref:Phosphodiesterase n=1 Tax=Cystoisospora suis TaxID=483139 RepID=A0A2C6KSU7_9APIC|nr:3 5 -cyclic nucleotide phosphodiesterase domain-containing protein [Cystoisospora suis]